MLMMVPLWVKALHSHGTPTQMISFILVVVHIVYVLCVVTTYYSQQSFTTEGVL